MDNWQCRAWSTEHQVMLDVQTADTLRSRNNDALVYTFSPIEINKGSVILMLSSGLNDINARPIYDKDLVQQIDTHTLDKDARRFAIGEVRYGQFELASEDDMDYFKCKVLGWYVHFHSANKDVSLLDPTTDDKDGYSWEILGNTYENLPDGTKM